MSGALRNHVTPLLALSCVAAGASGCAEVYLPRPNSGVVVTGNGGNGYRIFKDGQIVGDQSAVDIAVQGDRRAEAEAEKASSDRVAGFVTSLTGAIAMGVGVGLLADDASVNPNQFPTTLGDVSVGLVIGGAVLSIIGGVLQGSAHTHMFNAVNIYNDDLAARSHEPRVLSAPPAFPPPGAPIYISPGPGYAPQPVYPAPASPPVVPPPQLAPLPPPAPPPQLAPLPPP